MFIIFWRGIGILVPIFSFVAFILAVVLSVTLGNYGVPEQWTGPLAFAVMTPLTAGLIWYIAVRVGGRPKRILVDEATGREVTLRADAGSFMFIPTRFWAFIVLCLGLLLGYATMEPPTGDQAAAVPGDTVPSAR